MGFPSSWPGPFGGDRPPSLFKCEPGLQWEERDYHASLGDGGRSLGALGRAGVTSELQLRESFEFES